MRSISFLLSNYNVKACLKIIELMCTFTATKMLLLAGFSKVLLLQDLW